MLAVFCDFCQMAQRDELYRESILENTEFVRIFMEFLGRILYTDSFYTQELDKIHNYFTYDRLAPKISS